MQEAHRCRRDRGRRDARGTPRPHRALRSVRLLRHREAHTDAHRHIFGLASSSKPITAVAILMLVESGDIRLSDPGLAIHSGVRGSGAGRRRETRRRRRRLRLGARDAADHGPRSAEARLGPPERRIGSARRGRDDAARAARHARDVHSEARRGAARFSTRHVVALQRPRGLRRAVAHRRGRVEATVRRVLARAHLRAARHARHAFYYTGRQAERLAAVHARRDGKLESTPRDLSNVVYFSGAGGSRHPSRTICSSRRC